MLTVIDKFSNKILTELEILAEVNRDHSDKWQDYTLDDLHTVQNDVIEWLDPQFYIIRGI